MHRTLLKSIIFLSLFGLLIFILSCLYFYQKDIRRKKELDRYSYLIKDISKKIDLEEIKVQSILLNAVTTIKFKIRNIYNNFDIKKVIEDNNSYDIKKSLIAISKENLVSNIVIFNKEGKIDLATYNIPEKMANFSILDKNICPDYVKMQNEKVEKISFMPFNYNKIRDTVAQYALIFDQEIKKYIQVSHEKDFPKEIISKYLNEDKNIKYIAITTPSGDLISSIGNDIYKKYIHKIESYGKLDVIYDDKITILTFSFGDEVDYCIAKNNNLTNSKGQYYHILYLVVEL